MVVPGRAGRLFPGAREVLAALRTEDIRVVGASNTLWRTAEDHRQDFELNGVAGHFGVILTSLDEGLLIGGLPPGERRA
jgi:ribonucleotide monophosphatase NagD (HAD superfamily)